MYVPYYHRGPAFWRSVSFVCSFQGRLSHAPKLMSSFVVRQTCSSYRTMATSYLSRSVQASWCPLVEHKVLLSVIVQCLIREPISEGEQIRSQYNRRTYIIISDQRSAEKSKAIRAVWVQSSSCCGVWLPSLRVMTSHNELDFYGLVWM